MSDSFLPTGLLGPSTSPPAFVSNGLLCNTLDADEPNEPPCALISDTPHASTPRSSDDTLRLENDSRSRRVRLRLIISTNYYSSIHGTALITAG